MTKPLLATKLHIPPLRTNRVPRPHLIAHLDEGLRSLHRLFLISAPAGFGKTTLLGEWIQSLDARSSPPVRIAWISLDDGDNDPARFAAYLAAALDPREISPAPESGPPRAESVPPSRPGDIRQASGGGLEWAGSLLQESQLVNLINQVAALPQAWVLVLDDYHLITSQAIHDAMTFVVDHLPGNLHLVIATRADPPLPLPRLRARDHLTELRQSDLRFSAEEATLFLNQIMGLDLSTDDVAALEARTEGWIAGLQMAALSLPRQKRDPTGQERAEFIRAFTGSHRFVLDYLVEEVLDQQPPVLQRFLLRTSILGRLTGPLCDSILATAETGELVVGETEAVPPNHRTGPPMDQPTNSQDILAHLEAANLFIVSMDHQRGWYRYHRLFSDLLRKRLQESSPDLVPVLHRRASAWHEQQGLIAAAIEHALAARDFERAASLLEDNVEATLMRSEVATFLKWVEQLPETALHSRPTLSFYHAWALLMSGLSLDTVKQRLRDMASLQEQPEISRVMAGRMAALEAYLTILQADVQRAAELCYQALENLPENDLFLRNIVGWILSMARLADGDLQDGQQALQEVARKGQEIGNPLIAVAALCHQARLQVRQGRLHRAQEILERALQLATDPQGRRLPVASEPLIGLGELELEWNHLGKAAEYLTEGIALARQWSELAAFDAYFPLALTRRAQGDMEGALEALEIARQIARRSDATEVDDLVADLQEAYILAAQGDVVSAMRWAERRGLVPGAPPDDRPTRRGNHEFVRARLEKYEHLVLARLYIIQGQAGPALDLLEPVLALARELSRTDLIIESQILIAQANQLARRDPEAMDALAEALALAEPGGYRRIFLDEGEPMANLLRQAVSQGIAPAYAAQLVTAFAGPASPEAQRKPSYPHDQPLAEPLSERELDVLRLLATGMSNPEIADELVVAVSTIRSHCKSIYGKLGVHSRWDAVSRAQELGLI